MFKLYSYFRSSAAFRVRIVLNLKAISYETIPVHLVKEGGQQFSIDYQKVNPQQLVPTLEVNSGSGSFVLSQSCAINEYLEEQFPSPALLPDTPKKRAQVRALVQMIACEIHPLNNLRVLRYLQGTLNIGDTEKSTWYHHWIERTFTPLEHQLELLNKSSSPNFAFEQTLSLADVTLIPQVYNALRFQFDLAPFPRIRRIYQHCMRLEAFKNAAPEQQADAE